MKMTSAPLGMLAVSAALALGTAVTPGTASAVYRISSGGTACQPANGSAPWFQFTNNYLINNGTTDKYVVCNFVIDEPGITTIEQIDYLYVNTSSGAVGGQQAVCSAQIGYHASGATTIAGTNIAAITLPAGSAGPIVFNVAALPRPQIYHALTLNCRVPGGWKIGLLELRTS